MLELLIKSSIAIGVALIFYKLVLQRESFFATNRLYLVGCLALAFALPFISLPKMINQQGLLAAVIEEKFSGEEVSKEAFPAPVTSTASAELLSESITPVPEVDITFPEVQQQPMLLPQPVQMNPEAELPQKSQEVEETWLAQMNLQSWLMLLYFFGVGVFTLSLLFQLGCVFFEIMRSRDKIRDGQYIIVNTATRKAPCSFFKYIFIYPDEYDFETYEQIIKHEKTHVKLGHSFDLLFAELAVIALWFNPLIWLFKKEIEKNNEYQTDSILVEKEKVRKDQYQLNLLQIAVPNKPLNITTNYNQSLIKQRIIMMNSKRSTPHAYWKYSFLAPLFLGMLLLLNEPATGQEKKEEKSTEAEKETSISEEQKIATYPLRKEQAARERQVIRERERNAVREREQLQVRTAIVEERRENVRERLEDRAALAEARRAERAEFVIRRSEGRNISFSQRGAQVDMTSGSWTSNIRNGQYCIEFRGSSENANWNMSNCFDKKKFEKRSGDTFAMTNEVGTLELKGNLDQETGQGKFTFTENSGFRNLIDQNNITGVSKNMMFHMFFGEMTSDYVKFLKKEYPNLNGDELVAVSIHGLKQKEFTGFVRLFEKHSNKKPNVDDVVGLKIHGVTEAYVEELQKMGFSNLSIDDIMSAKIHGISGAYFKDLKNAGFTDLSMDEIITARIHGVEPQTIKEMRAIGARDLDKIVELKIHNVNADFIKELQAAGLGDLSMDDIVTAKIHGLNAATIKELKAIGSSDLDFDDLVSAKIHGVNAAFVKDLEQAGFSNLDMDKVVSARIHGVDGKFIEKSRKDGYDLNSIDKYISLKIHGSAMESLKDQ